MRYPGWHPGAAGAVRITVVSARRSDSLLVASARRPGRRWALITALLLVGCSATNPMALAPSARPSLTTSEVARVGAAATFVVEREWPSNSLAVCVAAAGSGVHIGSGIVLTAAHVIYSADDDAQRCPDGTFRPFTKLSTAVIRVDGHPARVIGIDQQLDLALLGVPNLVGRASLPWGDAQALSIGDSVIAVGFPVTGRTVTSGIVSALKTVPVPGSAAASPFRPFSSPQPRRTLTLIQTDAALNPGNSGGPLLNMAGELVGVVDFRIEGGNYGLNFAVASTTARPWVETMRGR